MVNEKILVIIARGISETMHGGVLRGLEKYLDSNKYEIIVLPYRAEYGPVPGIVGLPFEQNLAGRRFALARLVS